MMAAPMIERSCRPLLNPLINCGDAERIFLEPGNWQKIGRRLRWRCELWAEAWADYGELLQHSVHPHDHFVVRRKNSVKRIAGQASCWASRGLPVLCRLLGKAGFEVGNMAIVSFSVQLWLEMLLAFHYNRLSWVAPLANLPVVPLSSLTLAAGLFSALTAGIPVLSNLTLETAGWLASILLSAAEWMSSLPAAWQRCPTPNLAWVIAGILVLAAWRFFDLKRLWIPVAFVILSLSCLSSGFNPWKHLALSASKTNIFLANDWSSRSNLLTMTFLDVGEGDAMAIEFPNRGIWVLDSGGVRNSTIQEGGISPFDVGEAVVSRYLWWKWVAGLDRLLLSHPDQDHAGGMTALLRNFRVSQFSYSGSGDDALLRQILASARDTGAAVKRVQKTDRLDEGEVVVEVLNPRSGLVQRSTNEDSMTVLLRYNRFSALLTGDLEKLGETDLLSDPEDIHSKLLKVAHHGSRFATSDLLLERVAPAWGIVSAGRNNPFGHPSRFVLLRLLRHGARPLITSDQGAITMVTDGLKYQISSYVGGTLESGSLP
jgi:competence protein ComEC